MSVVTNSRCKITNKYAKTKKYYAKYRFFLKIFFIFVAYITFFLYLCTVNTFLPMKQYLYICLFLLSAAGMSAQTKYSLESDIIVLNQVLNNREKYESEKRERISNYQNELTLSEHPFSLYKKLYNEYKSYNFDTALIYVSCIDQELAIFSTPEQRYEALLDRGFIYLSGGLFKEAIDAMEQIQHDTLPIDERYYVTYARLVWDMGNYSGNELADVYRRRGIAYMQQAAEMYLQKNDSAQYSYCMGSVDLQIGNDRRGMERFLESLRGANCSAHDSAMIYSSMAHNCRMLKDTLQAFHYYVEASCCDIRSCTKEAIAMRYVAHLLYQLGRVEEAERYIRIAQDDAVRYNARHRQLEISQILPIIEGYQLQHLRTEKRQHIVLYSTIIVLLFIVIIVLAILFSRTKIIANARTTIAGMNETLTVANRVKEQLLGNMLAGQSQYLNEVEKYQQNVKRNAANHLFAELQVIPRPADAQRRRQVFFRQLDEMLLDIYPSFVEDFNALLRPEERFELKPNEKLTPEMRIFALIRLGIQQNDAIAQVMNYSVNTVYAYKTRTKSKSNLSSEEFNEAVMRIPSFRRGAAQ